MIHVEQRTVYLLSAVVCLAAITSPCLATTIHVPNDYSTIQAGINAASAGDTILIACGIYHEHDIEISTSGIYVMSENGTPECVTIDAQGAGRVFHLAGVDTTTCLVGLAITGGFAGDGGGMYCEEASPTLIMCHILANTAQAYGGGMFCSEYASPKLYDCDVADNHASRAGAILCQSSAPSFERCRFIGNSAWSGDGAIRCRTYCSAHFEECEFIANATNEWGGALTCVEHSGPTLIACTFRDNHAGSNGGAIALRDSRCAISDCLFKGNSTNGEGGAIDLYLTAYLPIHISNTTFSSNQASTGGAIHINYWCSNVLIDHCTFSENSGAPGGGIYCISDVQITLKNTIIAFSPSGEALYCDGPDVATLTCCDLYGNAWGDWNPNIAAQYGINGNISEDPLFCGAQNPLRPHLLDGSSPCAEENNPECGQIGAWPIGCGAPQALPELLLGTERRILRGICPNPLITEASITYVLPDGAGSALLNLTIYDEMGRHVRRLSTPEQKSGISCATWDRRDDRGGLVGGGKYFCRLRWKDIRETKPVLVIR